MSEETGARQPQPGPPLSRLAFFALPFVIFAAIGATLAVTLFAPADEAPAALVSEPAPELDLAQLGGDGRLTRGDLTGTGGPVVVNFWASWCIPCRYEHPALLALSKRDDVAVFGVAYRDPPDKAAAFLAELGDPFAKVGLDERGFGAIGWGVRGVPETFILNGAGEIVYKHVGPIVNDDLEARILPAIEAARR